MTRQEAEEYVARPRKEHPETCSCGSPSCIALEAERASVPYDEYCSGIIESQTDEESTRGTSTGGADRE